MGVHVAVQTQLYMDELGQLVRELGIQYGDFVLASGKRSRYYFDGKRVTLNPRGAYLVGELFLDRIQGQGIDAVGGLTVGADPIATAITLVSGMKGTPIPAFIVRTAAKDHGMMDIIVQGRIDGHGEAVVGPGRRVAIVDDVATTGTSCVQAINVVKNAGATVAKVIVLVDRKQGAEGTFKGLGIPFEAIFQADQDGILSEWKPGGAS